MAINNAVNNCTGLVIINANSTYWVPASWFLILKIYLIVEMEQGKHHLGIYFSPKKKQESCGKIVLLFKKLLPVLKLWGLYWPSQIVFFRPRLLEESRVVLISLWLYWFIHLCLLSVLWWNALCTRLKSIPSMICCVLILNLILLPWLPICFHHWSGFQLFRILHFLY